jgi:transcriptional regulator with XRE-family HTH domain
VENKWYLVHFGENVRRQRIQCGLSQDELASVSSLDRTYISGIERGKRNPTVLSIKRIADALGLSPSVLFDFKVTNE